MNIPILKTNNVFINTISRFAPVLSLVLILIIFTNCHQDKYVAEIELPQEDSVKVFNARLVFAGDLMQHMPQVNAARLSDGEYDYLPSLQFLKPMFQAADLAFVNLETTLSPRKNYSGYPRFRSPAKLADALLEIGTDIVVLANNHICDNGKLGIDFTIQCLDSLNMLSTGAFSDSLQYKQRHPLYLEANGINLALLNYTYGTNGLPIPKGSIVNIIDTAKIASDIKAIDRSVTDAVIVFFHWGDEYARRPNKEQKLLAELCHNNSVEIVIGSHPHVVQPIETKLDADSIVREITVYSLGNLVSNQRDRYRDGGIIVSLDIQKTDSLPLVIKPYYTPLWVSLPSYILLPPSVADTFAIKDNLRKACNIFFEDTRKLISNNPVLIEEK